MNSPSIAEIFSVAAELPDLRQREAYLDRTCGVNTLVRARIEALLIADGQVPEQLGDEMAGNCSSSCPTLGRIGRYALLKKVGEGGGGIVYFARQIEPVRRAVALKILKRGMESPQIISRFEGERQALALMDHPNIAKVLDASSTDSGKPYFVMEWVPGETITAYCNAKQLTVKERIRLIIPVCHALQHAHNKGVIHRDLKPSNVLVTESEGVAVPKVIDFGIAKAIEGSLHHCMAETATQDWMATPAYMSPEQARRESGDVDTRTDVYSLGVIVYEMLTGQTPFDGIKGLERNPLEMARLICEEDPMTPSRRVRASVQNHPQSHLPARLFEAVAGGAIDADLDWIVMKCLEKDRTRRYETAASLAHDLKNYLNDEAVEARPPSAPYRCRKWLRRNRAFVIATCGVMLALVSGLTVALFSLRAENRVRRDKSAQAYRAAMQLATRELREGKRPHALQLLKEHLPVQKEEDYRDWEWYFLAGECAADTHVSVGSHSNRVSWVTFIDNSHLLSAGTDPPEVWDLSHPSLVQRTLSGNSLRNVLCGSYSSLRHGFFSRPRFGAPSAPTFFDLERGEIRKIDRAGAIGRLVLLSPDERRLTVSIPDEIGISFFDLDKEALEGTYFVPEGKITAAKFIPDTSVLAISASSGHIYIVDSVSRKLLRRISNRSPEGAGHHLIDISHSGQIIVTAELSHPVKVWDLHAGTFISFLEGTRGVISAAFAPDDRLLCLGSPSGDIFVVDTQTWEVKRIVRGHSDEVDSVAFSPDGSRLASSSRTGEIKIWTLDEILHRSPPFWFPWKSDINWTSSDGGYIGRVRLGKPDLIDLWDARTAKRVFEASTSRRGNNAAILPDGSILTTFTNGVVEIRDWKTGTVNEGQVLAEIFRGAVSPDGRVLVMSGRKVIDGAWYISAFRLPGMEPLWSVPGRVCWVVAVSEGAEKIALYEGNGWLDILSAPNLHSLRKWRPYAAAESAIGAFSPQGKKLAIASGNGAADIWDLDEPRLDVHLPRMSEVSSLAFSPDGRRLALAAGAEVMLFDVPSGEEVWRSSLHGLQDAIVAFIPDRMELIAAGSQGIRRWQKMAVLPEQ